MNKCNHILGTIDDDNHDYVTTAPVEYCDLSISTLRSLNKDGFKYKFCPNCGIPLDGMIEKLIAEKEEEIKKEKEQDQIREAKNKENREKLCKKIAKETMLDQLDDALKYVVVILSPDSNDKRNCVVGGTKEYIIKACADWSNFGSRKINILHVYKSMSDEQFKVLMVANGYKETGPFEFMSNKIYRYVKDIKDRKHEVELSDNTTIYLTVSDLDGDKRYDRFSVIRLKDYLKTDVSLEEVFLSKN